jgi:hypothetical protein
MKYTINYIIGINMEETYFIHGFKEIHIHKNIEGKESIKFCITIMHI